MVQIGMNQLRARFRYWAHKTSVAWLYSAWCKYTGSNKLRSNNPAALI